MQWIVGMLINAPNTPPPSSIFLPICILQAQAQVSSLQTHVADQVKQSESNLAAQYQVLMQQQQVPPSLSLPHFISLSLTHTYTHISSYTQVVDIAVVK